MINFDDIKSFKAIYIYGAGKYGQMLERYLNSKGIDVASFVVSDGQNNKLSKKCLFLSDLDIYCEGLLIVALSQENQKAIKTNLSRYEFPKLDIYYLKTEDYFMIKRQLEPVDFDVFNRSHPAAGLMGCDRGTSIIRYYIRHFLNRKCHDCCALERNIKTYEVGDDRYSREYFPDSEHLILDYSKGTDLTQKATLPHNKIDVFICTQVFNYIYDVKKAIDGAYYCLNRGGILLATVTGNISQVSRSDMKNYGDYWRFTYLSIRKLMEETFGKGNVEIYSYGNAMAATAFLQGMCVEDLPNPGLLDEVDDEYSLLIGIYAKK